MWEDENGVYLFFLQIIFEAQFDMSFSKKTAQIMHTLQTDYGDFTVPANKKTTQPQNQSVKPCRHNCSAVEVKINTGSGDVNSRKNARQTLLLQTPIIIQKKCHAKSVSSHKYIPERKMSNLKKVQPFVPISIPSRDKKSYRLETNTTQNTSRNKEIQIFIENDGEGKQCLKKIFKKVHSLTDQLAESEKQRARLQLQFDHVSKRVQQCKNHDKVINKLEAEKYKLELENEVLKKKVKDNDRANPKETIRQMVVQRPVQVKVEVPKYIPGPQRIVERIIEVPKYVQIQKKIPQIIIKEIKVPEIIQKQVFIQKPVYKDPIIVDKPVFVEKPVYIDHPVQKKVEVQVQVPVQIEVPVYIDRPIVDDQWIRRFQDLEDQLGTMMKQTQHLKSQNHNLKVTVSKLQKNLDLISNHNRQKNREVELLLSNREDYLPLSLQYAPQRKDSALDRTNSTLSPRSHHHLRYL